MVVYSIRITNVYIYINTFMKKNKMSSCLVTYQLEYRWQVNRSKVSPLLGRMGKIVNSKKRKDKMQPIRASPMEKTQTHI